MQRLLASAILVVLGAAIGPSARGYVFAAGETLQSVTGTVYVDLRQQTGADVQYRVVLNAYLDSEDGFQGTVSTQLTRGDQPPIIALGKVSCAVVSGNSAWIGSFVTLSTNDSVVAPGEFLITYVRDFGDSGDVVNQELVRHLSPLTFDADGDGDVDCNDRPVLFPTIVESGNILIK